MRFLLPICVMLLAACAAPGVAVDPLPGDFAFLQVNLLG